MCTSGPPIIFNFGDSKSDTGNLAANLGFPVYPPNGRSFFRRSTDHLSEGRLLIDFLLKKSALRRMPVSVYGSDGVKVKKTECPICLAEFADGEKIRVLPKCNHRFHMRCVDTWLASHTSCPTCRRSLVDGGGRRADALVIVVG